MVTHWMVETETWKSRPRVARATATMVVSRIDMIEPSTTTVAMRRSSGVRTEVVGTAGHAAPLGEYFIILKDMYDLSKSLCETAGMGLAEDAFDRFAGSPLRASTSSAWRHWWRGRPRPA